MAETDTQQPDVAGDAIRSALGTEMGGPLADIYKKERDASRKVAESQLSQKEGEARGIQKAQESFAGSERQRYEAARPQINAPPPKFNVTQDTQEGLMGLATLLPIAGILIGSKGMMSGTNAMNAMTGVMKGYQEGNKERMTFEKQKYDVAMKEWDTHIKQVKDSLDKYTELAKYDLSSATSKAKADAIAKGHGVIGDLIDQQGLVKAREIVEKMALEKQKAHTAVSKSLTGGVARSAYAQQFEDQVAISVNEAAAQIQNMAKLPFSTTGIMQGRNTKGFLDAPLGALGNALTPGSVQQYNNNVQGLGYELAKVLGGGRVVPVTTQQQFAERFAIRSGDKPFTVLEKLANMRQTFERGIEVKVVSPGTTPELKEIYARALKDIREVIPFTTQDVLTAQQEEAKSKGKSVMTFGDFMQKRMGGATQEAAPKTQVSTGEKKSAEERFNELEASGIPEADIFKKMQGEGY